MNKLPFLKSRSVPILRKQAGESRYGFSEDDELIESALDELNHAVESKDHVKLVNSLKALIHCIMNKEPDHAET